MRDIKDKRENKIKENINRKMNKNNPKAVVVLHLGTTTNNNLCWGISFREGSKWEWKQGIELDHLIK